MSKLLKECFVCIKKSFKRFLSILLIILLGVGFYAGIKATSPDMQYALNHYYQKANFYDIAITNHYGVSLENLKSIQDSGYYVEGSYSFDAIVKDEEEYAVKVISYNNDNKINKVTLKEGRFPKNNKECVIEKNKVSKDFDIGDKIIIDDESLYEKELTITGIIESPLYISSERDSTSLLSGKIDFYLYVMEDNFNQNVYSYLYIDLDSKDSVFSDKYDNFVKEEKKKIKEICNNLSVTEYEKVVSSINARIDDAKDEYEKSRNSFQPLLESSYLSDAQKEEIQSELTEAANKIDEAIDSVNQLDEPDWYVLGIDSNIGFYQYDQDTERISNVAKVFPAVFFVVAILICLTTMTRMVEEERVQIGTFKSLGYTDKEIMFKYVLYALLATVIGSLIGVCIGFAVIPKIIFNMYSMMYNVHDFSSNFYIDLTLQGMLIAVMCTLGATIYTCIKTLKEAPAQLLLPKAPKPGKRVFLENVAFIWKKLSFSWKVTVRNVFRYKKRFLMTIIGISGCCGLIVAGFGLKDCITQMVPNQYEDVFDYQVSITLKENLTPEEINDGYLNIKEMEEVYDSVRLHEEAVTLTVPNSNQNITLVVPIDDIRHFIKLRDRKTKKVYKLADGVIVSEKLCDLLDISVSDTIVFEGNSQYEMKVNNITENYLYHYIYMSKDNYIGDSYNTILLKTNKMSRKEEIAFSKKLNDLEIVSAVSFTSASRNTFDSTMDNFGYISLVLIISAGLLALVVLYNLASVNISERKRELASIKVLGFYDREVYQYVSRETSILTVIGMFLGLGVGKILTTFIIKTCELDMFMFDPSIKVFSYVYAILITLIFTILVNILVYFALRKIDMIESLKSVE